MVNALCTRVRVLSRRLMTTGQLPTSEDVMDALVIVADVPLPENVIDGGKVPVTLHVNGSIPFIA